MTQIELCVCVCVCVWVGECGYVGEKVSHKHKEISGPDASWEVLTMSMAEQRVGSDLGSFGAHGGLIARDSTKNCAKQPKCTHPK